MNYTYQSPLYIGKSYLSIKGISDIQKYLKKKNLLMQTIFFVLKHQINMHIEFLCISECCCWNNDKVSLQSDKSHLLIGQNQLAPPDRLNNSSFFCQIATLTITLTLHCSSSMVGGHEK
jgi:hypothetical protein